MARGENPSQVERMRAQGYTEEEIEDMLKCDQEIDQGADLFPLDPELEKGAKKARRADRTDAPKKAERKPNADRQFLIRLLASAIHDSDNPGFGEELQLETINAEREFLFTFNGIKYKVVLSAPRGQ